MGASKTSVVVRTKPASYTPTLSDSTNVSVNQAQWHRDGAYMYIEGDLTMSGAGAGGTFTVSLPSGYTIDTAKLISGGGSTNPTREVLGMFDWFDNGAAFRGGTVEYSSTSAVLFAYAGGAALIAGTVLASGDGIKYNFKVPISGWA